MTLKNHVPKCIMIFGLPGSGKSTFSLKLSRYLHLPLYHLDKYYFMEYWTKRDKSDFLRIQQELVDQNSWIIDGNAIGSLEMRYKRADLVLYMCYPRRICFLRVFKRLFSRDPNIYDRAPNCQEQVEWELLKYLWQFDKRVAPRLKILHETYPMTPFSKITNDLDLKNIWDTLIEKKMNESSRDLNYQTAEKS